MLAGKYWSEIWRYRELVYILSWRDIKIRYKQTVIGIAWNVVRPLITTIIFTLVFNRIARLQNPSPAPYGLMVLAGMLPWQFFSTCVSEATNSITANAGLISKVYFPRLVIPISTLVTGFFDFVVSFIIIFGALTCYRLSLPWQVVMLPFFIVLLLCCTFGISLLFSSINVRYRDMRHLVTFVVQAGLYITPVAFSSHNIPGNWRLLYSINPLVGIVDGFRWTLLNDTLYWPSVWISIAATLLLLWLGISYFRKTETTFADNI